MPNTIRAHAAEVLELRLISTSGVEHNITPLLLTMSLNMSLFNKAIFGSVTIGDGVGVHYLLPIIGEERLILSFRSRGRDVKTFEGRVTSMVNQEFDDSYQMAQYTLEFVSEIGFQNLVARKVSHYTNANPLDAIYDLTDNYLNTDKFVETMDEQYAKNVEVVYPKVDPFKAIDMVCSRTYEQRGNRSSLFMFYEDLDALKFINIESLFEQTNIPDYFFDVFETEGTNTRDREFYRILNISYDQKFNTEHKFTEGLVDSELIRFDPITKRILSTTSNFRTLAPDFTGYSEKKPFITTNTSDFLSQYETKDDSTKDIGRRSKVSYKVLNEFDSFAYKSLAFSKSAGIFEAMFQTMIEITVPGHTGRKPGDIINVPAFPRGTSFSEGSNVEEYLQGKFVVTGVRHVFNRAEITTILNLAKPSFEKRIESVEI